MESMTELFPREAPAPTVNSKSSTITIALKFLVIKNPVSYQDSSELKKSSQFYNKKQMKLIR